MAGPSAAAHQRSQCRRDAVITLMAPLRHRCAQSGINVLLTSGVNAGATP